ncbi:MAG: UPF0158 family protein [Pseudomonadales bacterium]|jgi:hypothetical protein|nr:UPF0158 family protein [Pseudomonadales bacterium]
MTVRVRLAEIAGAFEEATHEAQQYLDRETGEILFLPDEFAGFDEDEDPEDEADDPEWMQEERAQARLVQAHPERFLRLPDQAELDEPRIIRDFCASLAEGAARKRLEEAFRGRGAFRRFKDALFDLDLEQAWYVFQRRAFERLAVAWCEEHDVPLEPERG